MATRFNTAILTLAIKQGTAPEVRSKALANFARQGVAELIATGKASPKYKRFVDGREGLTEDSVRPDGTIAYEFGYMGNVAVFALEFLRARTPIKSGKYRDSLIIAVDGRPVPQGSFSPSSVPNNAELYIYSPLPYSRKADVQLIGGRKMRFNRPPGMYDDAARAVKSRFGNYVTAERVYTLNFPGKVQTKKGRTVEYPALHIVVR